MKRLRIITTVISEVGDETYRYFVPVLRGTGDNMKQGKNSNSIKPGLSESRQRILSWESIRYVYSTRTNVLHDKTCATARNIPDEKLQVSGDFIEGMNLCKVCMMRQT